MCDGIVWLSLNDTTYRRTYLIGECIIAHYLSRWRLYYRPLFISLETVLSSIMLHPILFCVLYTYLFKKKTNSTHVCPLFYGRKTRCEEGTRPRVHIRLCDDPRPHQREPRLPPSLRLHAILDSTPHDRCSILPSLPDTRASFIVMCCYSSSRYFVCRRSSVHFVI